jgi:hypothetical protein
MHIVHDQNEACSLGAHMAGPYVCAVLVTLSAKPKHRTDPTPGRPSAYVLGKSSRRDQMKRIVGAIALVSMTAACAGRAPTPVPVVQAQDRLMDCAAITAEAQANSKRVQELGSEEGGKVAQNVAAGVIGLFFWPVWFAMDFQGAAGKEISALQSRQQYLGMMAEQKNCAIAQGAPVLAATIPGPRANTAMAN